MNRYRNKRWWWHGTSIVRALLLVVASGAAFHAAHAAVTVRASSTKNGYVQGGKTLSWSHTVAQTGELLVVTFGRSGYVNVLPEVTFGTTVLTRVADEVANMGYGIYYLANPPVGTSTVGIENLDSGTCEIFAAATSFLGADLAVPIGAYSDSTSNAGVHTATVASTTGGLVFDQMTVEGLNGTTIIPGTGQTVVFNNALTQGRAFGASTKPGANSVTVSWTLTDPDTVYQGLFAIAIRPASGSGTPATVTTLPATSISVNGATLNGEADPNGSTTSAWFRYSATNPGSCNDSFGTKAPVAGWNLGSGTRPEPYAQPVTGLAASQTYYFCAIALNGGGLSFGGILTFTTSTPTAPPSVTTSPANPVTATSATLHATANPNGSTTSGWFRYATSNPGACNDTFGLRAPGAGGTAVGSGTSASAFQQGLTGLTPATTYYFCAIASNANGTGFGAVLSFTTASAAPSVVTLSASGATSTAAQLNGSGNPNGANAQGWFRYSATSPGICNDTFGVRAPVSGGTALGGGAADVPFNASVSGLAPGATYYFCAIASNANGTSFGALLTFTTQPAAPAVTTSAASNLSATGATLNGLVNPNGLASTGWFRFGQSNPGTCNDSFGTRAPSSGGTAFSPGTSPSPYSVPVAGLSPGATYYFCAIGSNASGTAFGSIQSFTAAASAVSVTTLDASAVGATAATLNATANPDGQSTTGWFRYSTDLPAGCDDTFGTSVPAAPVSLGAGTADVPFSHPLTSLAPGRPYYYCAIASNAGGTAFGAIRSFITLATAPSVSTLAASGLTSEGATLHATATPNGATATGWFRYSTTSPGACTDSFGTRSPGTGGAALGASGANVPFAETVGGLQPGRTYYYCAIAGNAAGVTPGALLTFTTPASPPEVVTRPATAVGASAATLHADVDPRGAATEAWFRYSDVLPGACDDSFGARLPTSGGTQLLADASTSGVSEAATSLLPGTTYYYCAIASNAEGVSFGAIQSFTSSALPPTVSTQPATAIAASSATLNGSAMPNGASTLGYFRYGTTAPGLCDDSFGTRAPASGGTSLGAGTGAVSYAVTLAGLDPQTTYYFCALVTNAVGTVPGSIQSFTTDCGLAIDADVARSAAVGVPYRVNPEGRVLTTGASGPVTFSLCAPLAGPALGFQLDAQTGRVWWEPQSAGVANLCVSAQDACSSASFSFSATVSAAPAALPTASLAFSPIAPTTGAWVDFDGSASLAAPGLSLTAYDWEFGDGLLAQGAVFGRRFLLPGSYTVRLGVVDALGQRASAVDAVPVSDASCPSPPRVQLAITPEPAVGVDTFSFECQGCPAGLRLAWSFGDGQTSIQSAPTHTYAAGRYTVELAGMDAGGCIGVDRREVWVADPSGLLPPLCTATANVLAGPVPLDVTFTASFVDPNPGVAVASAPWTFSDAGPTNAVVVSRQYGTPGSFEAALTVVSESGLRCTTGLTIVALSAGAGEAPSILSRAPVDAECAAPYQYLPVYRGQSPVSWSLEQDPPGGVQASADAASGRVHWIPSSTETARRMTLIARNQAGEDRETFEVTVTCRAREHLDVGCGCAQTPSLLPLMAGLGLLLTARRRRARVRTSA